MLWVTEIEIYNDAGNLHGTCVHSSAWNGNGKLINVCIENKCHIIIIKICVELIAEQKVQASYYISIVSTTSLQIM